MTQRVFRQSGDVTASLSEVLQIGFSLEPIGDELISGDKILSLRAVRIAVLGGNLLKLLNGTFRTFLLAAEDGIL